MHKSKRVQYFLIYSNWIIMIYFSRCFWFYLLVVYFFSIRYVYPSAPIYSTFFVHISHIILPPFSPSPFLPSLSTTHFIFLSINHTLDILLPHRCFVYTSFPFSCLFPLSPSLTFPRDIKPTYM